MKKLVIVILVTCLMVPLFLVTPARADRFWPGVAVGVGSAILLSHLIHPQQAYRYDYPPVRVYGPPTYCQSPPAYRERWIPGHWVENYGPYGGYSRYWVSGHWVRY